SNEAASLQSRRPKRPINHPTKTPPKPSCMDDAYYDTTQSPGGGSLALVREQAATRGDQDCGIARGISTFWHRQAVNVGLERAAPDTCSPRLLQQDVALINGGRINSLRSLARPRGFRTCDLAFVVTSGDCPPFRILRQPVE